MSNIVFFDLEVGKNGKILDIGAVDQDGKTFHSSILPDFIKFISTADYLCGHNIIAHDLTYIKEHLQKSYSVIDTLHLSPILFPKRPYHNLVKDDKLLTEQLNNPLNDAFKAKQLFEDEQIAFNALPDNIKRAYYDLLGSQGEFEGFFKFIQYSVKRLSYLFNSKSDNLATILDGQICNQADIQSLSNANPIEFAYAFSIIRADERYSLTPPWVKYKYPVVDNILHLLRNTKCNSSNCKYCKSFLDSKLMLKKWFGYDDFRKFEGESLQENAVNAAIAGKSLLAIFPTGGGKSLTFQLPALIAGEATKSLTVVISPLQSLMKDQVENLEKRGIAEAAYINGLLTPIERSKVFERIFNGEISILYIAPEQLRSKTLERALLGRTINRFVIDEAHCFSAWGQDFRIEYQYIASFLNELQKKKGLEKPLPVSCFTATARPKVIADILEYFEKNNGIYLEKFTTSATRTNLKYTVLHRESASDKYQTLRSLLQSIDKPSIVYVSRTKTTEELALKLCKDGLNAKPFHGQMDTMTKIANQESFLSNRTKTIVATSAFGMGVDKSDVGLVVHYDISDSLENYLQEAGRAGRDVHTNADCYVLYNDNDLNKHFILLNQTKLTISEINQIWRAIKALTKNRRTIHISPLEVARKAGWEDMMDIETKVKSAIFALENGGYVRRGMNSPRIFATSIIPNDFESAAQIIDRAEDISEEYKVFCKRIFKSLISQKSRSNAHTADAESRVDYLSDMLGIETPKVIRSIEYMRSIGILSKDNDMVAYLRNKRINELGYFARLEIALLNYIKENGIDLDLKIFNESAINQGIKKSKIKDIKTLLFFWQIENYCSKILRREDNEKVRLQLTEEIDKLRKRVEQRIEVCRCIISEMEKNKIISTNSETATVHFSMTSLLENINSAGLIYQDKISIDDLQEALLFLSKTGIISIEGGFMVIYNKLEIERVAENNLKYKKEDYKHLDTFYQQRIQQIHIVGEFANMVVKDYDKAMEFVKDYFHLDFKVFIKKYFDSAREKEISQNVSPAKFKEIFGTLTPTQQQIIDDKESKYILVPAGPGSGKTFVLVRKLASLLLMEDVKSDKLLMLTFSRAAASEFRSRLTDLIGNAAKYVEIKTFHSYCFDITGQRGTLEKSEDVVKVATQAILENKVENSRITKSTIVIDEAQDMSADEFALIEALIAKNEDIRIIAVGDDDQNIYTFRGSDSSHLKQFITKYGARKYNMLENFRSAKQIIACANEFVRCIPDRIKTAPIICMSNDEGSTRFTLHKSENYEEGIVQDILSKEYKGSIGVLTSRNEDALILTALLNKNGRKAKLIQSNNGFSLLNLMELRYFIDSIKKETTTIISDSVWKDTLIKFEYRFKESTNYKIALKCITTFENEYQTKYLSDLENFILESQLSDFEENNENEIIVSTIHKSKGHEYDNVFISLKGMQQLSDEEKRAIYVGLTRAKMHLSVHSTLDLYRLLKYTNAQFQEDNTIYGEPDELMMQLTHKDVFLGYFKFHSKTISTLTSGMELEIEGDYGVVTTDGIKVKILKFSEAFNKKLSELYKKGYHINKASILHIVYWKYEETQGEQSKWYEIPIILPELYLKKSNRNASGIEYEHFTQQSR